MAAASESTANSVAKSRHVALVRSRSYLLSCLASAFGGLTVASTLRGARYDALRDELEQRDSSHVAQFHLTLSQP